MSNPQRQLRYSEALVDLIRDFTTSVLESCEYREDAEDVQRARIALGRSLTSEILAAFHDSPARSREATSADSSARPTPRTTRPQNATVKPQRSAAAGSFTRRLLATVGYTTSLECDDEEVEYQEKLAMVASDFSRSILTAVGYTDLVEPAPESARQPEPAEEPQDMSPLVAVEVTSQLFESVERAVAQEVRVASVQAFLRAHAAEVGVTAAAASGLALLDLVRNEVLLLTIPQAIARRSDNLAVVEAAWQALHSRREMHRHSMRVCQVYCNAAVANRRVADELRAWHARLDIAAVMSQRFTRAYISVHCADILRTRCFEILQRICRGGVARRFVGALQRAIPLTQSLCRAFQSSRERNRRHEDLVDHHINTLQATWSAFVAAHRVRVRCTRRAHTGLTVLQGACRSKLLQLMARRVTLLRVTTAPPSGVNRVLQRLLLFMPGDDDQRRRDDLFEVNERRRELTRNSVRRAATPAPAGSMDSRMTNALSETLLPVPRGRQPAHGASAHTATALPPLRRQRSRSAGDRREASRTSPYRSRDVNRSYSHATGGARSPTRRSDYRSPGASTLFGTVTRLSHPDYSIAITEMSRLVALAKVANSTTGDRQLQQLRRTRDADSSILFETSKPASYATPPAVMSPRELVRLAKVTVARSGAAPKKPDWH
jgi:hypothetical protein